MNIELLAEQFHFVRPWWLLALVPALILYLILHSRERRSSNWEHVVDRDLLPHLLVTSGDRSGHNPFPILLLAWALAILAAAGPAWDRIEQPVHEKEDALVILLDLSLSMYAEDVKPNRLVAARRKLIDLLKARKEGLTALIVYAGDAHTVSPLTDDTATIASMVPALAPEIMPVPGSNLAPALDLARQLFRDGGAAAGRVLVITDEVVDMASSQDVAAEDADHFPISILAVGTPEGAPISLNAIRPGAGYLKDTAGDMVIPKLDRQSLTSLTSVARGRYAEISLDNSDLDYLLAESLLTDSDRYVRLEREFDTWLERGPWLLLLVVPLAALAFRRGWIWLLLPVLLCPAPHLYALTWEDLWKTPDQQGAGALAAGDASRAARLFEHPGWKGSAQYRDGAFADAAKSFESVDSSDGQYNRGNALARQGDLEAAIAAYDKALKLDADNSDARFNKELLERLLKQQQKNQQGRSNDAKQGQQGQPQNQNEGQGQQQGGSRQQGQPQKQQGQMQQREGQSPQQAQGEQQGHQQAREAENNPDEGTQGQRPRSGQRTDERERGTAQNAGSAERRKGDDNALAKADEGKQTSESDEEQRVLRQWLREIPDDPGGLLKNKFRMQSQERRNEGKAPPNGQVW